VGFKVCFEIQLVPLRFGRLVGVNTAIFTNTGASAGVGFAIPVVGGAYITRCKQVRPKPFVNPANTCSLDE
jgi:S1-C subfamily serine protease